MHYNWVFMGFVLTASALEVIADILLKTWAIGNNTCLLLIGLLAYFIGTVFWAISLKYEFLSRAISIFSILNFCTVVVAGLVIFKEDITLINKIGIGLGIISIILIEIR
jgi:multidrug transporter EmrE-like cation transporter